MESQTLSLVTALVAVIVFLVLVFTGVISGGFIMVLRHNKEYVRMAYESADPRTQHLLATGAGALKQGADTLEDLANLAQEVTGGNAQKTTVVQTFSATQPDPTPWKTAAESLPPDHTVAG